MNLKKRSDREAEGCSVTVGIPVPGFLGRGERIYHLLELDSQAMALFTLEASGFRGVLTILDPMDRRVRGWMIDSDGKRSLAFVADMAGKYRLQLQSELGTGNYQLTLEQTLSLEERVSAAPDSRLESPRIKQLRADLATHPSQALAVFWREVEREGTPLLEDDPLEPRLTLCTFLWRGDEQTRNVRVHLLFRTMLPNDYTMAWLEGTDLWYTTIQLPSQGRFAYTLLVNVPPIAPPDIDSAPRHKLIYFASSKTDPLNRQPCLEEPGGRFESLSSLVLPGAPPQPWMDERLGVSRGALQRVTMKSELLQDERFISAYTPPGYSTEAKPYGLLLVFDEQWYLSRVPTPTILDNLLADGKIPPLVAIVIGNGPGDARSRQLPCNPLFADFMATELIPWAQRHYNVTNDPSRTIIAGSSYGGLASTYVALHYPERFGNVLSQSGSYWWQPSEQLEQFNEPNRSRQGNHIAGLFIQRPKLALRFYLDAGTGEIALTGTGRSILVANRHLRDVLLAKGYEVHYQEFIGGHDFLSWRGTLADGLIALTSSWDGTSPPML